MTVFFYTEENHALYFKELLKEKQIAYEYQLDEEEGKFYFGIKKNRAKEARKLNYLVFAKYRKPFIQSPMLKYGLVALAL